MKVCNKVCNIVLVRCLVRIVVLVVGTWIAQQAGVQLAFAGDSGAPLAQTQPITTTPSLITRLKPDLGLCFNRIAVDAVALTDNAGLQDVQGSMCLTSAGYNLTLQSEVQVGGQPNGTLALNVETIDDAVQIQAAIPNLAFGVGSDGAVYVSDLNMSNVNAASVGGMTVTLPNTQNSYVSLSDVTVASNGTTIGNAAGQLNLPPQTFANGGNNLTFGATTGRLDLNGGVATVDVNTSISGTMNGNSLMTTASLNADNAGNATATLGKTQVSAPGVINVTLDGAVLDAQTGPSASGVSITFPLANQAPSSLFTVAAGEQGYGFNVTDVALGDANASFGFKDVTGVFAMTEQGTAMTLTGTFTSAVQSTVFGAAGTLFISPEGVITGQLAEAIVATPGVGAIALQDATISGYGQVSLGAGVIEGTNGFTMTLTGATISAQGSGFSQLAFHLPGIASDTFYVSDVFGSTQPGQNGALDLQVRSNYGTQELSGNVAFSLAANPGDSSSLLIKDWCNIVRRMDDGVDAPQCP